MIAHLIYKCRICNTEFAQTSKAIDNYDDDGLRITDFDDYRVGDGKDYSGIAKTTVHRCSKKETNHNGTRYEAIDGIADFVGVGYERSIE